MHIALLVIIVAEKRLGSPTWLAVYFGGGIITEFLALAWQPYAAAALLLVRDIHGLAYGTGIACAFAARRLHEWRPAPFSVRSH